MRAAGARGLLIYCSDYHCSHGTAISGGRWPDEVRLSDFEPKFTCQACGRRGADVRPDFGWEKAARPALERAGPALNCSPPVRLVSALGCILAFGGFDGQLACKAFYGFRCSGSELDAGGVRHYLGRNCLFVVVTPLGLGSVALENSNVPHPLPDIGNGSHRLDLVQLPSRWVLSD
jgi:hypothetical protein